MADFPVNINEKVHPSNPEDSLEYQDAHQDAHQDYDTDWDFAALQISDVDNTALLNAPAPGFKIRRFPKSRISKIIVAIFILAFFIFGLYYIARTADFVAFELELLVAATVVLIAVLYCDKEAHGWLAMILAFANMIQYFHYLNAVLKLNGIEFGIELSRHQIWELLRSGVFGIQAFIAVVGSVKMLCNIRRYKKSMRRMRAVYVMETSV